MSCLPIPASRFSRTDTLRWPHMRLVRPPLAPVGGLAAPLPIPLTRPRPARLVSVVAPEDEDAERWDGMA